MKDLIVRFDERIDTYNGRLVTFDEEMRKSRDGFGEEMRRSREQFDFKMNVVLGSQIRNDEQIAELKTSVNKLEISSRQLEIASRSQLGRIERLETA